MTLSTSHRRALVAAALMLLLGIFSLRTASAQAAAFTISATLPAQVSAGGTFSVPVSITDTGGAASGFNVYYQLYTTGYSYLGIETSQVESWTAGQTLSLTPSLTAPATTGTYQLLVIIDNAGGAYQYGQFFSPLNVVGAPPPTITSASLSPASLPVSGGSITLTAVVTDPNAGATVSNVTATVDVNGSYLTAVPLTNAGGVSAFAGSLAVGANAAAYAKIYTATVNATDSLGGEAALAVAANANNNSTTQPANATVSLPAAVRQRISLDSGWQFNQGDIAGIDAYPGATNGIAITQWKYQIDANAPNDASIYAAPGFNDTAWTTATAGQNVFQNQVTDAWFRVHLESLIPAGQDVGPHYVSFESVDDNATVYLNGNLITRHIGWNEQFVVQLDPYWVPGGPNELAVIDQNTAGGGGIGVASLLLGSSALMAIGTTGYNDTSWTTVHLPHDYVVAGTFTSTADAGHGYLPVEPAWYRKSFTLPASDAGSDVWIDFDGAYRNAVVYINGHYLGIHPSGYIGCRYDITQYLNFGSPNEIAVHVDPTWFEGWWYEGGGIYRHVWLNVASPVHVAPWGVYVASAVSGGSATENISTTVANATPVSQTCTVQSTVYDPNGVEVFTTQSSATVPANGSVAVSQTGAVTAAFLWSLTNPYLYRLNTTILQNGNQIDSVNTPFGIRTIQYTAAGGFFLNGQHVYLQGMCNHEDFIGVGSGMPDSVLYYRLQQLKAMGCNAYRTSHGPTDPELLDDCDQLGILVMDENRHLGDSYESKAQVGDPYSSLADLKAMIERDRNHPSVIMWSMCNEEWNTQGNAVGEAMLAAMKSAVYALDSTRPVTCANNGAYGSPGFSDVVDIMGINYNYWVYPDIQTASYFPNLPDFASETSSSFSTRGVYADDTTDCWSQAYDLDAASWGDTVEGSWQEILAYPNMAGGFYWTGFDYLGEETPYAWPAVSSQFGSIDRCGFPKDDFYFNQSAWTTMPMVHILPHWNWTAGQTISVWAYSNCSQVELFLNGVSLGVQTVVPNSHLVWSVPWAAGTLTALGYNGGATVATDTVNTAGTPYALTLTPTKTTLAGDGEDTSVVKVSVVDAQGNVVPTANNEVTFAVTGPGHVSGVGNGNPSSHEPEQGTERAAFNGLCAALVQSNDQQTGAVTLTATSPGLVSAALTVSVAPPAPTALTAAGEPGEVSLSWTASSGTYSVYRGTYSGGESAAPVATGLTGTSYNDTSVTAGTTYYYTVVAANSYGTSPASNEAQATPSSTIPGVATNVVATGEPGQITVTWNGSTNATAYELERSGTSGGPYGLVISYPANTTNQYQYIDTGRIVGKTYYYVVIAVNSTYGTNSGPSAQVSAAPLAPIPSLPGNVTATGGPASITVSWSASTNATEYELERSGTAVGGYSVTATVPATAANSYSYTDSGRTVGKTYYYEVVALNTTYKTSSGPTAPVSAVPVKPVPAVPANVTAVAGTQQITVSWTASAYATEYEVERGGTSGGPYGIVNTVPATAATTYSFTDTGRTVGKTYYYVVIALNTTYNTSSGLSAQVSAAATAPAPSLPGGVTATAGTASITVSWSASTNATEYELERSATAVGGYSVVTTIPATAATTYSYTDTGRIVGKTYYYEVIALNTTYGTNSGPTSPVSAVPL